MAQERIVIYNLSSITGYRLFAAARALNDQGHTGPAIVVAQAAVEVGLERAISMVLEIREVPDELQEWIGGSAGRSWSPTNGRVRRLWAALTGDELGVLACWESYKAGADLRHAFAHRAAPVDRDDADTFIIDAEQVLAHVGGVMSRMGKQSPS